MTLVAVSLAVMMASLDSTVLSVANPTIQRDLHASLPGLQWVSNSYLLALAVFLILGGKLGDRFGRRLMFGIGVTLFGLGSLGCALSTSIGVLVTFRVIQGVAGAVMMPNTLAILRTTFPGERLMHAVGTWNVASALAVAAGPIIGGLLVQNVSWQSIFFINVPLAATAVVLTLKLLAESRESVRPETFDTPGVALLTLGLGSVVWALIQAQSHPWLSGYVLGFGIGGLLVLALFVLREWKAREPILPLEIFRSRSVSAGTALVVIGFIGLLGVMFFLTLYLQNVHGYDPVQTGIRMLPLTGVFIVSPVICSVMTHRFGPRPPLVIGMLAVAGAFLGLGGLRVDSPYIDLWPWFVLLGLGLGFVITATTQAIVGNIPAERGGVAGGLQTTANALGGVLGTAILGSILVSSVGSVLGGKLAAAGVTGHTAEDVISQKEAVGSGIAPVTSDMSQHLQHAIATAAHAAFMDGLHVAMMVATGLAIVGALIGLLIEPGHSEAGAPAAGSTVLRQEFV